MWSNPCPRKRYVVTILRCEIHSKTTPPAAKKRIESREETHQSPHVVCSTRSTENYEVSTARLTWSNYVVGVENHTPFLPQQVLYCNLEKRICQVVSQLICCALFATRRSDTTSLTQYTASVIAVCKAHLK